MHKIGFMNNNNIIIIILLLLLLLVLLYFTGVPGVKIVWYMLLLIVSSMSNHRKLVQSYNLYLSDVVSMLGSIN